MSHAVSRLRAERLARSFKPFRARGSHAERCEQCRLPRTHCLCAWRPRVSTPAGFCLLMHDIEPLKPTNTGWLIADLVSDTEAFTWARTRVDPRLPALLADPGWQPYVVFPAEYAAAARRVSAVAPAVGKRPLFVLLDASWPEARRMFRKSPYLDRYPVLGFQPQQLSRYKLRRARRPAHLCTAEVAALCLELAGDESAARTLDAYLDVFIARYLDARDCRSANPDTEAHARLKPFL